MGLRSKASPAHLLPDVATHGLVVLMIEGFTDKGGEGSGGERGVNVTSSTLVNTTPCHQMVYDISSLAGSNKNRGGGYRNVVHGKPAGGNLKAVFWIIATSKERPGDSNSYLLAQLEH